MRSPIPSSYAPHLLSLLRIVVGVLFMLHGTQKLFGVPTIEPRDTVELVSLYGLAGILETFGGALIVVGLLTRPVAFVLALEMAIAYFYAHAPNGVWPILNRGEAAAYFCFTYLYFAAAGAGPWSLDAMFSKQAAPERASEP